MTPASTVATSAVEATHRVLARFGLPQEVEVVREGTNTTLRCLHPALVARIGHDIESETRTAALTAALADAGLPVTGPVHGPEVIDGLAVTLWPLLKDVCTSDDFRWRHLGRIARQLHSPATAEAITVAGIELADAVTAAAARCHARLRPATATVVGDAATTALAAMIDSATQQIHDQDWQPCVVHGDLRVGNLVGFTVIDWEFAGIGPREFDDASVAVWERRFAHRDAYRCYLRGYERDADPILLKACSQLIELSCVTWMLELAVVHPQHRQEAKRRVRDLLAPGLWETAWWDG